MTFRGHTGQVSALAYSPDGKLIATSGTDGTARLWDPLDREAGPLSFADTAGAVVWVAFTRLSCLLATRRSEDGSAKACWDVTPEGGRDLLTLVAHAGAVHGVAYVP